LEGVGKVAAKGVVEVVKSDGIAERHEADHIILATGSRPREIAIMPVDGKRILSSRDALTLSELPESMIIVGSGAIGCEFAWVYAALGVKVIVVEYLPAMLPLADEEVSRTLERSFRKMKATVLTGTAVKAVRVGEDGCEVDIEGKRLVATVDTSKFEGQVEKTIDATTADGKTTRLTMRFTVPPAVQLSARNLQWRVGAPVTPQTLRITLPAGSPVRNVTEAALSGEDFNYDPRKGKRPGEYSVTVTPKSTAKRLRNRLVIKMESADPRFSQRIIYLRVNK
jgi:hypothetical protein